MYGNNWGGNNWQQNQNYNRQQQEWQDKKKTVVDKN